MLAKKLEIMEAKTLQQSIINKIDLLAFEKTQKSRFFVKKSYVIFSRNYKRASI